MKKRFLIYLLLVFCINTLTQKADAAASSCRECLTQAGIHPVETPVAYRTGCMSCITANETAVNPPRPTSFTNALRHSTGTKRQSNYGGSGNPVIKSGKLLNQRVIILSLNSLRKFPSGLMETTHHLISLGKLVI